MNVRAENSIESAAVFLAAAIKRRKDRKYGKASIQGIPI